MPEHNEKPADALIPYLKVISEQLAKIGSDIEHVYFATAASLDEGQTQRLRQLYASHIANAEMAKFRDDLDNIPTTEEEK